MRDSGLMDVNLDAFTRNYAQLCAMAPGVRLAPVLKADAYGLGMMETGRALGAMADDFFVAWPGEGAALRSVLPKARIFILHGCHPGQEGICAQHNLVPVHNTLEQARRWAAICPDRPCALHVDTGMSRLGLEQAELEREHAMLAGLKLELVMSHLACADDPQSPHNAHQRERFLAATKLFPGVPRSLSASGGLFLGPDYHFEMVRPGIALSGHSPGHHPQSAALETAVRVEVPVLCVHDVAPGTGVGYGLSWSAQRPTRLATVGIGYADGFLRALSPGGGKAGASLWLGKQRLPVVGKVSMDSIIVDATALPEGALAPGQMLTLVGPQQSADELAALAGTIGYEVLLALGTHLRRRYWQAGALMGETPSAAQTLAAVRQDVGATHSA
ncbi:alanine racemase [Formicincola oecophyllae]|uniref:Alanine racemase n=1 Tax=Formicincola oecophyllae TaxID=2558361 RepID=A0A4Y6U902_9PROT|nr:alanine racemase [Formicincola oecophyllae]QDH12861.1 alanine racemase [Formicincola oecophyllae]